MIFHQNKHTGLELSLIGLGTVKLGRDQGVKYPSSFTIPDDREARQLLGTARELGINLIDTAPAYGNSEERLGKLLKGERNQWVICSKVGEEFSNGQSSHDFSPEHTVFSIERSLKRLDTDALDIVLVHSDGNDMDIINHMGTLDALQQLKQQGKIRAFGFSGKTVEGGLAALEQSDAVMVTFNLQEQAEAPVIQRCHEQGKICLIKKAFGSGHFATKEEDGASDPVKASMDCLSGQPGISSIIIGTINETHLRHNVAAALSSWN
jgi:aryl-alcohol dehydrogenase-like predicted oxidoreductase